MMTEQHPDRISQALERFGLKTTELLKELPVEESPSQVDRTRAFLERIANSSNLSNFLRARNRDDVCIFDDGVVVTMNIVNHHFYFSGLSVGPRLSFDEKTGEISNPRQLGMILALVPKLTAEKIEEHLLTQIQRIGEREVEG